MRLSEYVIGETAHFLDLNITILDACLHTSLYTKPSHLRVLLHFGSAHSNILKQNVVLSQLIRIYRLNTDLRLAGESMYIFIQLMIRFRNLKPRTARSIWTKFLNWLRRQGRKSEVRDSLPLLVANNVFTQPFKRALDLFANSLSHSDQLKLGNLSVREQSGRALGQALFYA